MDWLHASLVVSGGLYGATVLWLWRGLLRNRLQNPTCDYPSVSVVVAARDEEGPLPACLAALAAQDYPGPLEVVVVDDRSRDRTGAVIAAKAAEWSALKAVRAEDPPRYACPKKSALAQGIAASTGEILLFTDADCRPPVTWARAMTARFSPGVGLVVGYARSDPVAGWLNAVLAVDNIGVGALGAGSIGMGYPLSCTGRSLAYRREVYDGLDGFAAIGHLIGGDDVYFMRLVAAEGRWRAAFNPDAVVLSPPLARVGAIVQQKLRHAAKGGHYKGGALVLAVGVYLFHLVLALGLGRMLWTGIFDPLTVGVWVLRWGVDWMLLRRMATAVERPLLRYLPIVEVLYIPYVLFFTVIGRMGWFRWKT